MNSFGKLFRVHIFGESHGQLVGILMDGIPAGIPFSAEDLMKDLDRRRSGAAGTTPRKEDDIPLVKSGLFRGYTTGAPLLIQVENKNTRSRDYTELRKTPRPGHADFTAFKKFGGYEDYRGGGHFSGRLTTGLVAAGVLAKKMIAPARVNATILEVGGSTDIEAAVQQAIREEDSIGGIIECRIRELPAGIGEPFFDSVEAVLSHMVFSVPAIKGIEFGAGFAAAKMRGSEHNDNFISVEGKTETNHAGGINGGITNGNEIVFRVVVKPTSSTHKAQKTMNFVDKEMQELKVEGRHDTCIALRVPVVLEAAAAIAMADLMLQAREIDRINQPKDTIT
ncbi:MAG: chorismate synthase [Bacteroidales bacterium]|nr:chorismate synthase [Bacteroidales bacterium]MDT8430013.1 chorismate synthase [Bacteroidales bacterium]